MLDEAFKKIPKVSKDSSRFEIPRARIVRAGSRTIISNFVEIANMLRRDKSHLLKFLLKELATSGEIKNQMLVVQGRFRPEVIDRKIDIYVKSYVLCPECGRPDTKIIKEGRYYFLKCEACGSKHTIKKI